MGRLLELDEGLVTEARRLAAAAVEPVVATCRLHTTVGIERAIARVLGPDGDVGDDPSWPDRLVDAVREAGVLDQGVALPVFVAAARKGIDHVEAVRRLARGDLDVPGEWSDYEARTAEDEALAGARQGLRRLDAARADRERLLADIGDAPRPWTTQAVATGDGDENLVLAQARAGADVVAVTSSTDPVRADVRRMRAALDEVSRELGRYVRLASDASGPRLPELAVTAGVERVDVVVTGCLARTTVRDIDPPRTLADRLFGWRVLARAGVTITTTGDHDPTSGDTATALVASHLLDERFALDCGLTPSQIGLAHTFGAGPEQGGGTLAPAHAALVHELFPDHPLRYLPSRRDASDRLDGVVAERAAEVLRASVDLLDAVARRGLVASLSEGLLGDTPGPGHGGAGDGGVVVRAPGYLDPVTRLLG